MSISRRAAYALAAFITADTMLTFAISSIVLGIFRCDNRLEISAIVSAGVFVVQAVTAAFIYSAIEDMNDASAPGGDGHA